jgi:hypothetical protein
MDDDIILKLRQLSELTNKESQNFQVYEFSAFILIGIFLFDSLLIYNAIKKVF